MERLIAALIAQQEAEGLGNNAFARKLGVDKATWSTVRRGVVPSRRSGAIFEAAMRTYPDVVRRVATEFEISNISVGDDKRSESVPQPAEVA